MTMLTIDELEGLPAELIKEMRITKSRRLDICIYTFIKEKKEVDIDSILMHVYKEKGVVLKRQALVGRLYRLAKQGHIISSNSRTGWNTEGG